jgi:5'-nucleotidase
MSVNFPKVPCSDVTGICVAPQGHHKGGDHLVECVDPRGRPYIWIGPLRANSNQVPGSDMECSDAGKITVTPLTINLTHQDALEHISDLFQDD